MQIMAAPPLPCIAAIAILMLISTPTKPCLAATDAETPSSPYVEFVKKSCACTIYPDVCCETLSSYANTIQTSPTELANVALSVSLNGARSASDMVINLSRRSDLNERETGAVADCLEMISDSVDELRQSLVAMRNRRGQEFKTQMSNIQTWVSAALTNEDTCMDGFDGDEGPGNNEVKGIIQSNVVRVFQLTSNALAFVNRL